MKYKRYKQNCITFFSVGLILSPNPHVNNLYLIPNIFLKTNRINYEQGLKSAVCL